MNTDPLCYAASPYNRSWLCYIFCRRNFLFSAMEPYRTYRRGVTENIDDEWHDDTMVRKRSTAPSRRQHLEEAQRSTIRQRRWRRWQSQPQVETLESVSVREELRGGQAVDLLGPEDATEQRVSKPTNDQGENRRNSKVERRHRRQRESHEHDEERVRWTGQTIDRIGWVRPVRPLDWLVRPRYL
jgi:hypothetical protein